MQTEHAFSRDDVFPSWWANAIGKFLSLGAYGFQLLKLDATHIEVVAGADVAAAVIAVQGRWRWIEATITRAHPGGAAGTYDVFVTAKDNDIQAMPAPYTDDTDYSFALAIVTGGSSPPIVPGVVDLVRKVGSLQWDGAQITRIDQTVPAPTPHAHRHAIGQPDALAPADIGAPALATANEFAAAQIIDGTLTVQQDATMQSGLTVVGPTQFGNVVSTGPISGVVEVSGNAFSPTAVAIGAVVAGKSGITFQNGEAGSNLYRSAPGTLTVDGTLAAQAVIATSASSTVNPITGQLNTLVGFSCVTARNIHAASNVATYVGFDFQNSAGNAFYVDGTGQIFSTSTSIAAISDRALKVAVRPLKDATETLLALKPRRFRWSKHELNGPRAGEQGFGFISQEVGEVLPHLVGDYRHPGPKGQPLQSLRMGDLMPFVVRAVQELAARVDALEAQLVRENA